MGKGSRNKTNRAAEVQNTAKAGEQKLSKLQLVKKAEQKARTKKIIASAIAIIIALGVLTAIIIMIANAEPAPSKVISGTSEYYEIDNAMMSYFFYSKYNTFVNTYNDYLGYFGLDTKKSLKSQTYGSDGTTWFDYFMDSTKSDVEELVLIASAAKDAGVELNDDDRASIDATISQIKSYADSYGYTLNSYISAVFGSGVDKAAVVRCLELSTLASKYYNQVYDSFSYEDSDYNEYLAANPDKFQKVDFLSYAVAADYETDADDDAKKAAMEDAKAIADAIAAAADEAAFKAAVAEQIYAGLVEKAEADYAEEAAETDEEGNPVTPDPIDYDALKTKAEETNIATTGKLYASDNDFSTWAHDDSRKIGDTYVEETDTGYTVYYLTKTSYIDEYASVNVRHILLSLDTYKDSDGAKAKAEEVLAEYEASEKTAEAFAALAEEYSEDPGSNANGGLYENVLKGDMVDEFDEWIYDENRKAGDTGLVETDHGWHVMYYDSNGDTAWRVTCLENMEADEFQALYETYVEKYTLTFDDTKLNYIG